MSSEGCGADGRMPTGSKTGGEERGSDSGRGGAMMGSILTGGGGGMGSCIDEAAVGSITSGGAMDSITGGEGAMD